jgi:hypothetical protein
MAKRRRDLGLFQKQGENKMTSSVLSQIREEHEKMSDGLADVVINTLMQDNKFKHDFDEARDKLYQDLSPPGNQQATQFLMEMLKDDTRVNICITLDECMFLAAREHCANPQAEPVCVSIDELAQNSVNRLSQVVELIDRSVRIIFATSRTIPGLGDVVVNGSVLEITPVVGNSFNEVCKLFQEEQQG